DGAVADNHAAGVDAQVARLADQLFGELPDVRGGFSGTSGPGVHLACRVAERAGGIPQRTLTPVGDDVRDLGGVIPTVTAVDVLDDLLAAAGFDVKVDIRRAFTFRGEESFEEQTGSDGVDGGDAECETDGGVRRRATPLAEDVIAVAVVDDVVDDEEISGEAQFFDDAEFPVDDLPGLLRRRGGAAPPVAVGAVSFHELAEPGHLAVAVRHGEVR